MAVTVNIPEKEIQNLIKKVHFWEGKKRKEVVEQLRVSARIVQSGARERTPVGTPESTGIKGYVGGTLRAANQVAPEKKRGLTQIVENETHYALWVHEGTTKMNGRPFLRAASHFEQPKLQKALERIIKGK